MSYKLIQQALNMVTWKTVAILRVVACTHTINSPMHLLVSSFCESMSFVRSYHRTLIFSKLEEEPIDSLPAHEKARSREVL